jgi:hypothetical protein
LFESVEEKKERQWTGLVRACKVMGLEDAREFSSGHKLTEIALELTPGRKAFRIFQQKMDVFHV